jgi:hypothetical protein
MDASTDQVCQFLVRLPIQLWAPNPSRLETAICGKPAEWKLLINDFEPLWVCAEHYDILIAQGWSEA